MAMPMIKPARSDPIYAAIVTPDASGQRPHQRPQDCDATNTQNDASSHGRPMLIARSPWGPLDVMLAATPQPPHQETRRWESNALAVSSHATILCPRKCTTKSRDFGGRIQIAVCIPYLTIVMPDRRTNDHALPCRPAYLTRFIRTVETTITSRRADYR